MNDSLPRYEHLEVTGHPQVYLCEPGWCWEVASMVDHDLWCVLNGRGEMSVNGTRQSIGPGSCWLLEPGMACRASHDPAHRLRVFAVHFDLLGPGGAPRALRASERPAPGLPVRDVAMLEALARGCVESHRRGGALGQVQSVLYLRQLLLMLLQDSAEALGQPPDRRIARVHQAMVEDPGHAWTVPGMARQAGLSRSQFSRLFREAMGRSPIRCLLEARTERARHLLLETSLTVGEIAATLGYRDIFYFSRQFKAMTGQSPSQFRRC